MRIYAYLRASTKDQDVERAKGGLIAFVSAKGIQISSWFMENESGSTLKRPELFRLLDIADPGDVLLVEQVDRISRLDTGDWETLKSIIHEKGIRIVALDLPTSHTFMDLKDRFTERMLTALNAMMLDMLAAMARKAKKEGRYRGRPEDKELQAKIQGLLEDGKSYNYIQGLLGCSRHTISKVNKRRGANDKLLHP